ncbi:C-type lectin 37Da-like [Drosophila tropicalis]|uniref:C-type lectin 37Da-like n=1 Tax=Drosophila tropicalis TaxID=46794 RepID=UPI0035ABA41F
MLERNWFDAYQTCRLIGSELITIDTIEEWNLVNQYLRDMKIENQPYWTSGTDLANEGKHVWFSNGVSITLNDIWYPGEPTNSGAVEHCDELSFTYDGSPTGLNDRDCTHTARYICEAPQPKTATFVIW